MPASTQPALIEVGPLLTTVPFNRSLYVAETVLDGNIHLTPRKSTGTPAALRPILGARTFYRITGDGTSYPTFSSDFIKTRESLNFNREAGVVNLITFTFDGNVFNYTITPDTIGIEFPRWVGNFGVTGDQLIAVALTGGQGIIQQVAHPGVPVCTRSAFNLIKSLHYTGETALIFGVSKDGNVWVEDEDPARAAVAYSCVEVGPQDLYIRVRAVGQDPSTDSPVVVITIVVTDTEGYCI